MDLEKALNEWMDANETDYFDLIREAMDEFSASHPGMDESMVRLNALSMADRHFMSRALGAVLPQYLGKTDA